MYTREPEVKPISQNLRSFITEANVLSHGCSVEQLYHRYQMGHAHCEGNANLETLILLTIFDLFDEKSTVEENKIRIASALDRSAARLECVVRYIEKNSRLGSPRWERNQGG